MALQLAWLHAMICQQICAYDMTLGQRFSICHSHHKAKLKIAMSYFCVVHFLGVGADDASVSQLFIHVINFYISFPKSVPLLITYVLNHVCTDSSIKGRLISSASPHPQENAGRGKSLFFSSRAGFFKFSMYILHEKGNTIKYIQYPNNAWSLFFLENNLPLDLSVPPCWEPLVYGYCLSGMNLTDGEVNRHITLN